MKDGRLHVFEEREAEPGVPKGCFLGGNQRGLKKAILLLSQVCKFHLCWLGVLSCTFNMFFNVSCGLCLWFCLFTLVELMMLILVGKNKSKLKNTKNTLKSQATSTMFQTTKKETSNISKPTNTVKEVIFTRNRSKNYPTTQQLFYSPCFFRRKHHATHPPALFLHSELPGEVHEIAVYDMERTRAAGGLLRPGPCLVFINCSKMLGL